MLYLAVTSGQLALQLPFELRPLILELPEIQVGCGGQHACPSLQQRYSLVAEMLLLLKKLLIH